MAVPNDPAVLAPVLIKGEWGKEALLAALRANPRWGNAGSIDHARPDVLLQPVNRCQQAPMDPSGSHEYQVTGACHGDVAIGQ